MPEIRRVHPDKYQRWLAFALLMLSLPFLSGCERELSDSEAEAILTWSEPTIDRLFVGFNGNDYKLFSSRFDSYMRGSIPIGCFAEWKRGIENELGEYLIREVHRVTRADEFFVVTYLASFEDQESATIDVAFHASDHSISHISIEAAGFRSSPEPRRQCEIMVGGA